MIGVLKAGYKEIRGIGLNILTEDELFAIHCATLEVLQSVGVRVISQEAQDIFGDNGCLVDRKKQIVKIPPYIVEDALRSAPPTVLMAGRVPESDYLCGPYVGFTNFGEGTMVVDPVTRERHGSTKKDVEDATRMCDAMENLETYERAVGADDVPVEVQTIHNAEAIFKNTTKHSFIAACSGYNAAKIIEMAQAVVGGADEFRKRPIYTANVCPNSPLCLNPDTSEVIIVAARMGAPCNILSMALSGATTPVTMAGTLICHNAEVLSGIVLSQLTQRGAKVIYGSSTTIMDLRTATASVGAPEIGMYSAAVSRLARYYNLPSFVAGG